MEFTHLQKHDLTQSATPPNAIWLDSLDLTKVRQSWGDAQACKTCIFNPITLNGIVYAHGIGTHARSSMMINLKGAALKFETMVGMDDEAPRKVPVLFEIWVDGVKKAESGLIWRGDEARYLSVDLKGAQQMLLFINDGGEWIPMAHADWAGALLHLVPGTKELPETTVLPPEEHEPIPPMDDQMIRVNNDKLGIHGARIYGVTPGKPFLYRVPATGVKPLKFAAENLPAGLSLDPNTGIITGSLKEAGTTKSTITVTSGSESVSRDFVIVGGRRKLALTPPMGWNSWNVWGLAMDEQKVKDAADYMVSSGLADHGFQFINIDDAWEGERDADGKIQPNSKFPDMKALADYVHSKGLKLGIYSSPGPKTCGGYIGSYQHEQQDADTFAEWGIDYLKYDWCSYQKIVKNPTREERMKPYQIMSDAIEKSPRDIMFSICQYGQGEVWEWGAEVGGNLWRTTLDIGDWWGLVYDYINLQVGLEKYAGPGHWNDPDMLVVGKVGWGPSLHPSELTPHQQISHISIWCMLASPLLIGCDLTQLDEFTLSLLSNDEVLAVDQDPLGIQGKRVKQTEDHEVWVRPLFDGTLAVAVLNLTKEDNKVLLTGSDIGWTGSQNIRDLWLNQDLGTFDAQVTLEIPPQSTKFLKIGTPQPDLWKY